MTHNWNIGVDYSPLTLFMLTYYSTSAFNAQAVNDPGHDELVDYAGQASSLDELKARCRAVEEYLVPKHYVAWVCRRQAMCFWQPWLHGYSGQMYGLGWGQLGAVYARCWIDQELKAAMGY